MYAETDFLLALIEDEDWLGEAAEQVYNKHGDELWTSQYTLVELMLVGYREERDVERIVANAADLIEIRGDVDTVVAAASHVEEYDLTPFDALHLVESNDETIVSSDSAYEEFDRRLDLREVDDR